MEFHNSEELINKWKNLVKRYGYNIKEEGQEKDFLFLIAENKDYYLKLHNGYCLIALKERFQSWEKHTISIISLSNNMTSLEGILKLNKCSSLCNTDFVWDDFNNIKDKYNVKTPKELLNLIENDPNIRVEFKDSFVSKLLLIS